MQPKLKKANMKKAQKSSLLKKAIAVSLAVPVLTPFGFAQESEGLPALVSFGPFDFNAVLFAQSVYDDNIYLAPSNVKTRDIVTSIAPSMQVRYGEKGYSMAKLDYTPTFQFFKENGQNDAINHDARFQVEKTFTRLTVGLSQSFTRISDSAIGVGGTVVGLPIRLEQDTFATRLLTKYDFSDKTSFEANGQFNVLDFQAAGLISSKEYVSDNWINYKATERITTSAGLTFGYLDLSSGLPSQTYERGLVRMTYDAAAKLQFRATGGVEIRQVGGGRSDAVLPIFSVGATYRPLDSTSINLDASRAQNYAVQNRDQNLTTTGVSAVIRQELMRKLTVYFGGGFYNSEYTPGNRNDDYYTLKYGADFKITSRITVGAFHMYRDNAATGTLPTPVAATFRNHQFGVQASAAF